MEKDIAISVKNASKAFKIPHEKVSPIRGAAVLTELSILAMI